MVSELSNYLYGVVIGDHGIGAISAQKVDLSTYPEKHRQVMAFMQDLVHIVSRGRVHTVKHLALPMAIRHITGSSRVITILNRFGHCSSMSVMQEFETALAQHQISSPTNLPSNISKTSPVVFCWDNNDLLEDTRTGTGTTHCTNGIVMQRQVAAAAPAQVQAEPTSLSILRPRHIRSVELPPSSLPDYTSGRRIGPDILPNSTDIFELANTSRSAIVQAQRIDFAWCLSRMSSLVTIDHRADRNQQCVMGWTGFNAAIHPKIAPICNVGYCPVINASPTQLSTVYALLERSLEMADEIGQRDAIVVMDQAVYAKAAEIVWKHKQRFSRVILRLGAFHTACSFLSVIGKRYGDAGLESLLIESGVVGASAVSAVLLGKAYNRAIRCHKATYEALLRLLWSEFLNQCSEDVLQVRPAFFPEAFTYVGYLESILWIVYMQ